MPKVKCNCGFIFNLSIDSPHEYNLVPEEKLLGLIADADKNPVSGAQIDNSLSNASKGVLICPKCNRVLIEHDKSNRYTPYVVDSTEVQTKPNVYDDIKPMQS